MFTDRQNKFHGSAVSCHKATMDHDSVTMQFLLDCSVLPDIIKLCQESENPILSDIFYLTRSYIFKLFVTRRRLLAAS